MYLNTCLVKFFQFMSMYFFLPEARDKLRSWREENTRNSEEIIDVWLSCLEPCKDKLGDEGVLFVYSCSVILLFFFLFILMRVAERQVDVFMMK